MRDEELHRVRMVRHEISAECGHDVHRVAAYCRAAAEQLRLATKSSVWQKETPRDETSLANVERHSNRNASAKTTQ
jgi:hypothetical protein